MLDTYEKHSKLKLIATVLSVVVIAGCIVFVDHLKNDDDAAPVAAAPTTSQVTATVAVPQPTAQTATPAAITPAATTTTSGFKDGTYSATTSYYVPHGNESIKVNLTLKDGIVSDASVQNSQSDRESAQYQQDFASVYKNYVVGKKISSLKLGIIAGASDTTQGFSDAVSRIASKAQA